MPDLGAPELLIILVVVVLIFGGSRVAELGGSLGKGIKEFKKALREDEPSTGTGEPSASNAPKVSDTPHDRP